MPAAVPLIRGFALLPALRWLAANGVPIERALAEVGLSLSPITDPYRPIPLVHMAALLRNAAREHGPDLPCRIVSGTDNLEIAMIGRVALGSRTPAEALARIVAALPCYSSHERVSFERMSNQYVVRLFFAHRFDAETRHVALQYASAMVDRILAMTGAAPRFVKLEIPPHPFHGVAHLWSWFGDRVVATNARGITIQIEERIMGAAFGKTARDRLNPRALEREASLRAGETFSDSVKAYLGVMLDNDETPSIRRMAAAAGMSSRSFQRQLEREGASFSQLLAETKQIETLKRLKEDKLTIAAIAADLGYSDQAALTRAFRRWTGISPSKFRGRTTSSASTS